METSAGRARWLQPGPRTSARLRGAPSTPRALPQPSPDDDALVLGPAAPAAQHGVVGPAGHGEDVGRQHARLVVPVPLGDLRGKRWRSGGEGAEGRRGPAGGVRGDSPLSHTAAAAGRGSWR